MPIALPVRRVWAWRGLGAGLGRWVILRLRTEDGTEGLGEATPLPDWGGDHGRMAGETPRTVVHIVTDHLLPAIRGVSVWDWETVHRRMEDAVRGHRYAKAAVEMATVDLCGRLAGRPAHDLLGGRFRPGIPVAHMIGLMSREEAVEEAAVAVEDGVRAFQVKGTGEPERDLDLVSALRGSTPPGTLLRLDANQGYRTLDMKRAAAVVRALEDAGVDLIEQPTEGLARMAALRAAARVPIVADESCWGPEDLVDLVAANAADAVSIYVAKAGGMRRARDVATLAGLHGLPCDVNGSLESGVGNAASLHVAVAAPAVTLPSVIPVTTAEGDERPRAAGRYYTDDVVTRSFRFRDGLLEPPGGPGLGVELDEEKLERYRVET